MKKGTETVGMRFAEALKNLKSSRVIRAERDILEGTSYGASTISEIKADRQLPNEELLDILNNKYRIAKDWIMHGTGQMTPPPPTTPKPSEKVTDDDYITLPTWTGGAQASPEEQHATDVGYETRIRVPKDLFSDAEAVLDVFGNSMLPGYPAGAKLAIARIYDKDFFEWGEVYVLKLKGRPRPLFKRVYESDRPDHILLVSDNTMLNNSGPLIGKLAYPEQHLHLDLIDEVWEVIGDQKRRKNKAILLRELREKGEPID